MLPSEVQTDCETTPTFISAKWLQNAVSNAIAGLNGVESQSEPLQPIAFVRCSRGGKTRSLKEIAIGVKKRLEHSTAVIYISLNGHSHLQDWEQADPISAICRRIAFESRRQRKDDTRSLYKQFKEDFLQMKIDSTEILGWLANLACL